MYFLAKNIYHYRKVLPRERKKHIARRVATTPYAVLSPRGVSHLWWGVPHPRLWGAHLGAPHPDLPGGYPIAGSCTLFWGTPILTWPEGIPQVPPGKDMGPVKVLWNGDGVPPGVDRHTPVKTLPSRIPLEMRAVKSQTNKMNGRSKTIKRL